MFHAKYLASGPGACLSLASYLSGYGGATGEFQHQDCGFHGQQFWSSRHVARRSAWWFFVRRVFSLYPPSLWVLQERFPLRCPAACSVTQLAHSLSSNFSFSRRMSHMTGRRQSSGHGPLTSWTMPSLGCVRRNTGGVHVWTGNLHARSKL